MTHRRVVLAFLTAWVLLPALRVSASQPAGDKFPSAAPAETQSAGTDAPASAPAESKPAKSQPAETPFRVACIRLGGEVLQSPPDFNLFASVRYMTTQDWLRRLARARQDSRVHAVALEIDRPTMTFAQAIELADAVHRLAKVKPVHTHIVGGSAGSYLVAAAGTDVAMDPAGQVDIVGLAMEIFFYRGALEYLGIQPQFIQIGQFKGAAEPMTRSEPSEPFRKNLQQFLDSSYAVLCDQIARYRDLTRDDVRSRIDRGPFDARSAKKLGLVDRLVTRMDFRGSLARKHKGQTLAFLDHYARKPEQAVDLSNPLAVLSLMFQGLAGPQTRSPSIAIIHVDGVIVPGASGSSLLGGKRAGAETLCKALAEARDTDAIKAVVLRINSPGGSAIASELIHQAVARTAEDKPVIVSIGHLGASGGYYVAVAGRSIFADESAVVGSIGVVSGKLATDGLMDKLHLDSWSATRGRNAGLRLSRPWNKREQALIRRSAKRVYDLFVQRVRQGRGEKIKSLPAVAQGRVFTGRQAAENGLVDHLGGLRDAVAAARQSAGLKGKTHYLVLPRPKTLADVLAGRGADTRSPLDTAGLSSVLPDLLGRPTQHLAAMFDLLSLLRQESVLAAMPYLLTVQP